MLDADADLGRRAWIRCTACPTARACLPCRGRTNCPEHWTYLLASVPRWLFLQCPACHRRWWHDTGFGVGDRPAHLGSEPRETRATATGAESG